MNSASDDPCGTWRVPEASVAVEYSAGVMEEIRLAVLEAFYAFPRGGAEIGGILLGGHQDGVVRISGFRPLDCEHATGPSFVLSDNDFARLEALLRAAGDEVVGWYHSHTRSEIALSAQDLEIHTRYFRQPWQVALVLRPSSMMTRAGFFARGVDGAFRTESSYDEFVVPAPEGRPLARAESEPAPPLPDPVPPPEPIQAEPPPFLIPPPKRARHAGWFVALAVVALAIAVFTTRERWLAYLPDRSPIPVSLDAYDQNGMLQIRWDWRAGAIRDARGATLELADGDGRQVVRLEPLRLKKGSFSYARQTARVEVRLRLEGAGRSPREEYATFVGTAPPPRPSPEELELHRQRDELARELSETRTELIKQTMLSEALARKLAEKPAAEAAP